MKTCSICVSLVSLCVTVCARAAEEWPAYLDGVEPKPTFTEGVGRVIEYRCVHCHRPGGIAPMHFLSYGEVRQWAKQSYTPLDALIRTRAMPPWPADLAVGRFRNREFMTDAEIEMVLRWIRAGYPRGAGTFEITAHESEWGVREPDRVVDLEGYTVEADIIGEYRRVTIANEGSADRWIQGVEVRPGNPYIFAGLDGAEIGAYRTGNYAVRLPAPFAFKWEANQIFDLRVHYMKEEGIEETDRTTIGLYFAEPSPDVRPVTVELMRAGEFVIPAGTERFEVKTQHAFDEVVDLISILPDMRLRGKSVVYVAEKPDGTAAALLSIPAWNPAWKYRYVFEEPMRLPAGTVLHATAVFDNSEKNLKNPDPWSEVVTGPAGETFESWLLYAPAKN